MIGEHIRTVGGYSLVQILISTVSTLHVGCSFPLVSVNDGVDRTATNTHWKLLAGLADLIEPWGTLRRYSFHHHKQHHINENIVNSHVQTLARTKPSADRSQSVNKWCCGLQEMVNNVANSQKQLQVDLTFIQNISLYTTILGPTGS